jgi:hypothetical protein
MSDDLASFITSDPSASQPSLLDPSSNGSDDEIDSLPESQTDSDDVTVSESDFEESDAEKEWKESLQQLELLLSMVIVPYMGKYFGRKFAYWGERAEARNKCEGLLTMIQAGNNSWSGNTRSKSWSPAKLPSKAPEWSRLLHLCDTC